MDNIREKMVELLRNGKKEHIRFSRIGNPIISIFEPMVDNMMVETLADYLIANGVTVQEAAYWKDVMQINGECFGYCSNCLTEHKAQNYVALVIAHRYCRWCGRRLITTPFPQPPKGE